MTNFSDAARAEACAAPAQASSGAKIMAERATEAIMTDAEFKARVLPAIHDWIRRRNGTAINETK